MTIWLDIHDIGFNGILQERIHLKVWGWSLNKLLCGGFDFHVYQCIGLFRLWYKQVTDTTTFDGKAVYSSQVSAEQIYQWNDGRVLRWTSMQNKSFLNELCAIKHNRYFDRGTEFNDVHIIITLFPDIVVQSIRYAENNIAQIKSKLMSVKPRVLCLMLQLLP